MTLEEFMALYCGHASISIKGYCEEKEYDYYLLPDEDEEDSLGHNPNRYVPTCLALEPWWNEVRNRKVARFGVIGGGNCEVEIYIVLGD